MPEMSERFVLNWRSKDPEEAAFIQWLRGRPESPVFLVAQAIKAYYGPEFLAARSDLFSKGELHQKGVLAATQLVSKLMYAVHVFEIDLPFKNFLPTGMTGPTVKSNKCAESAESIELAPTLPTSLEQPSTPGDSSALGRLVDIDMSDFKTEPYHRRSDTED